MKPCIPRTPVDGQDRVRCRRGAHCEVAHRTSEGARRRPLPNVLSRAGYELLGAAAGGDVDGCVEEV